MSAFVRAAGGNPPDRSGTLPGLMSMPEDASSQILEVDLVPQRVEVAPGAAPVEATLVVRNRSRVVDQCTIEVVGLDATWFTQPTRSVALFPEDSERLAISFHVPNQPGLKAGAYPFR